MLEITGFKLADVFEGGVTQDLLLKLAIWPKLLAAAFCLQQVLLFIYAV